MLLVNQILHNRYRIMRMLGQGGMGAVYEAHDNVFDTTCAVKEIMIAAKSGNNKQQEMLLRAFEREAKLLAKIKHESVPHVRDYFTQDNQQYLVMELVEGKDLGELLEERKIPFPLEDVMRWMDQLLDGLDYLHTQNPPIFHRDLKPQNLKLTPRGKIKLLDFGIAKGGAEVPNSTTINNQTFVAATLNYSPIEQIFRVLDPVFREVLTQRFEARIQAVMQQNADARSDLYALGATAYHLLTGFLPLDSLKRTIEVWSGKPDPLDHPTKLNSHIPPEVANVLLKAMELDYNRRYASALEMQQALQQALADIKVREANQAQNTLEMSSQPGWQAESDRLRHQQQATRLPTDQSFSDQATQQIPVDKLPLNYQKQQGISEETIQSGALGYNTPGFGQNTGGTPPPTPNTPFNTGGSQPNTGGQPPFQTGVNQQNTGGQQYNTGDRQNTGGQPFNTGGQPYNTGGQPFNTNANQQYNTGGQYQSGGGVQPTEMVNFAGATGGNIPQAKFPTNPVNTGGAMNSNNPISPGANFAQNYGGVQQQQQQQGSSKAIWVVPLLLLMFLGVAGAGGGLYLWYQNNDGQTEVVTPTASPSVTASASKTPTATPSATPSATPDQSNVNAVNTTTPKPTVAPTATRPAVIATPVRPTQKPTVRPTQKPNSDCIFTGTC